MFFLYFFDKNLCVFSDKCDSVKIQKKLGKSKSFTVKIKNILYIRIQGFNMVKGFNHLSECIYQHFFFG